MRGKRMLGAAGVCVVALAGCGGDDDEDRAATSGTGAETEKAPAKGPATGKVTIRETDFKLSPSRPKVAKAGVVEFVARNKGNTTHALEVEGPKGEAETSRIGPGKSARVKVDMSKPGTYEMYCPVANHTPLGMEGEVVVAGGGSGGAGTTEKDDSEDDKGGGY
jgi:uncharacterized cupredoxin-like copper-binding protein